MANRKGWGGGIGGVAGGIAGSFIPIPGATIAGAAAGGWIGDKLQGLANRGNQMATPENPQLMQQGQYPGGQMLQAPNYSPEQMQLQSQLAQLGLQGVQQNTQFQPTQFDFGPIQKQYETQFNTETVPSIAQRFTNMGGGQRSSAFQAALGRAGAGLNEGLAALKAQYDFSAHNQNQQFQLQNQGQRLNLSQNLLGMGLQPQHENLFFPSGPTWQQSLAQPAGQAGIQLLYAGAEEYIKNLIQSKFNKQNVATPSPQLAPVQNNPQG